MRFSKYTAIFAFNRIRNVIIVMEMQCVFSKLGKECLDIINIGFHTDSRGHTDSCAEGNDAYFSKFKLAET
jgi:hypothetical protein